MRKDYLNNAINESYSESAFVENYWTEVWNAQGGPDGKFSNVFRQEHYKLMFPYLKTKINNNSIILDGGCGLGDWVLALESIGFNTIGIDISKKTIQRLNELFPNNNFIHSDLRETSFDNDKFDAYFSWGVFEHFEAGPGRCIEEAYRILKPEGTLFITVPMDNLRHSIAGTFKPRLNKSCNIRFYQYRFTRQEIVRELEIRNFKVLAVHPIHKRQGVLRMICSVTKLPYDIFLTRAMAAIIAPFLPKSWFAHMVMIIASKPSLKEIKS